MPLRSSLVAACLTLAACASGPREELPSPNLPQRAGVDPIVAARAEGVRFIAEGEAFHLRFTDRLIMLQVDNGEMLSFPLTEPSYPRWSGAIYDTSNDQHRLRVTVRRYQPCSTAAGQHVVEVSLDDREFTGCGREL